MRILVTGANGFIGRRVVGALLARDHQVRATVRRAGTFAEEAGLAEHVCDLRVPGSLVGIADDVDVVVHLAASKGGDVWHQLTNTVRATEHLLVELEGVRRIVHVSSFAVYDAARIGAGGLLDERSPTIQTTTGRDSYSKTKWFQERMVREWAQQRSAELVVIRPGIVYGGNELWNAHLTADLGGAVQLRIGRGAILPLTHVDNCADAIVLATEVPGITDEVVNIVDDDLPTQAEFVAALARRHHPGRAVYVPFGLARSLARGLEGANRRWLRGRAELPGLFRSDVVAARFQPMRYSNQRARDVLGWQPRIDWRTGIATELSGGPPRVAG